MVTETPQTDFTSTGRSGFAGRAGKNTDQRRDLAKQVLEKIDAAGLTSLRLSFADQHGVLRGKTLVADEAAGAMNNGCSMTSSLLVKDTSHKTVFSIWQDGSESGMTEMQGAGDFIMLPDPATFKILPWATKTGWMLCDIFFTDGRPVPFSTRKLLQDACNELASRNLELMCGLEVEFHVFKLEDANLSPQDAGAVGQPATAPDVSLLSHGYQYLTEQRADEIEPVCEILRQACEALALPLRSIESEFGPSQFEFTFAPTPALTAADNMMLFRSAVKQVCRRNGLHATFMCKPKVANTFASGWHLHQSLVDSKNEKNLFMPGQTDEVLSETGMCFAAGLLKHASEYVLFACPTVNAYKRFQPFALAPDRIVWGHDNKGAMLRVISDRHDPVSRIENRVGEPAANPYLYLMSQIRAGLDGLDNKLDPGPATSDPYHCQAEHLPFTIMDAVINLDKGQFFRKTIGDQFIDYYLAIKRAEIDRFMATVSDWEQREYFDIF